MDLNFPAQMLFNGSLCIPHGMLNFRLSRAWINLTPTDWSIEEVRKYIAIAVLVRFYCAFDGLLDCCSRNHIKLHKNMRSR